MAGAQRDDPFAERWQVGKIWVNLTVHFQNVIGRKSIRIGSGYHVAKIVAMWPCGVSFRFVSRPRLVFIIHRSPIGVNSPRSVPMCFAVKKSPRGSRTATLLAVSYYISFLLAECMAKSKKKCCDGR